jgi:hypothetical protein
MGPWAVCPSPAAKLAAGDGRTWLEEVAGATADLTIGL